MLDPATSRAGSAPPTASPVVVKPGAVAGDDDVVGLLRHVVLAGVHQTVDFSFTLFFIILQERERERSAGRWELVSTRCIGDVILSTQSS